MKNLKNVSSNGIPVGHRSTFATILKKYHKTTNPITKWALRDILEKRLLTSIKEIDSGSFTKYSAMLKDL